MPPAPSRRSTRYRPASNSPTRSRAELGRDSKTRSFTLFPSWPTRVCRTSRPPSRVNEIPGLAVDQVVHHHQVDGAARADVINVGAQRTGAERNLDPGDDRVGEGDPNEGEPAFVGPNRRAVGAQV